MFSPSSKSLTNRSKAVQDGLTDRSKAVQDGLTDRSKAVQDGLTDRSKAVLLLWIVFRVILSCLFLVALWSPAGKGLTPCPLVCDVFSNFVTFPYGVLIQMWYFIVWIPYLCIHPYLKADGQEKNIQTYKNCFTYDDPVIETV